MSEADISLKVQELLATSDGKNKVLKCIEWMQLWVDFKDKSADLFKKKHRRPGVTFHSSVTKVKLGKGNLLLDTWMDGMECGQLKISDGCKSRKFVNSKKFQKEWENAFSKGQKWAEWDNGRIKKYFEDVKRSRYDKGRIGKESIVESKFIQMLNQNIGPRKHPLLKRIQPAVFPKSSKSLYSGAYFRLPLPISGSSNVPKLSRGYVDILGVRPRGIEIFELKAPGNPPEKAITQGLIYACCLVNLMNNADYNKLFWKVVGKQRPLKIRISAVVHVDYKSNMNIENIRKKYAWAKDFFTIRVLFYKDEGKNLELECLEVF